jgi:ribosomal protein S27AE
MPFVNTFEILDAPGAVGGKAIRCLRCGTISNHPDDVEQHYCGRCCMCHDDIYPPARQWWVESYAQRKRVKHE